LEENKSYNFEIYLFGQGKFVSIPDKILPTTVKNYIGKTRLRQMCSLVYRMDMILSADSLFSHIAASFDIPSVVMYTTIPAEWRNFYYRSLGVQGTTPCCPCRDFQFVSIKDYEKCDRYGTPPCVKSITPTRVQNAIYQCIRKYKVGK